MPLRGPEVLFPPNLNCLALFSMTELIQAKCAGLNVPCENHKVGHSNNCQVFKNCSYITFSTTFDSNDNEPFSMKMYIGLQKHIRSVATGEGGEGRRTMGPPFSISEANRSSNFSFKHQEYCLLRVFSNYTNQKFHDFYRISTIFGQFTAVFHFFLLRRGSRSLYVEPSEKIRYLTLDLVKSFLLWTIRKKATMNQNSGPTGQVF